jgi:hypothetical protein
MKPIEPNGSRGVQVLEETSEQVVSAPPSVNIKAPFVPQQAQQKPSWNGMGRLLVIGAGIVLVLLLLAFNGMSRKSGPARKTAAATGKPLPIETAPATRIVPSMTPILDTGSSPEQGTDGSLVHPEQIAHTATRQTKQTPPSSVGGVRPFDDVQPWRPAPYQPGAQPAVAISESPPASTGAAEMKSDHDAMDKASLVFVRNAQAGTNLKPRDNWQTTNWKIGLAPGTRLRARLESAVSTAVRTPVVAAIEYNYEQNGEIVIPAGAKAFGYLESAARSGYIGIRFDSMMMPDGASVSMEAIATDLQLRPLRGKVEGRNPGKNILVRSLAGVGEITATLVGRGSLNQPLSEGDLLRERVSNNIGQAADQSIANWVNTEHVMVSVPAGTEIYVVLQKSVKESLENPPPPTATESANPPTVEELRKLIELQQELSPTKSAPQ